MTENCWGIVSLVCSGVREGGERETYEVENAPAEGDPEAEEEDGGFGEKEVEGAEGGDLDHDGEGGAFFVCFDFPADAAGGFGF